MDAKNLSQMPQVGKGEASSLRQIMNHVSTHIKASQALSFHVPVQDLMLTNLMLVTLDSETQRECELVIASRANTPTSAELVTIPESRCKIFELLQNNQSLKLVPNNKRSSHTTGKKVSKSYSNVSTQLEFSLLNDSHRLIKCDKFLKTQSRKVLKLAKKSGLCFNCLQQFTREQTCTK